MKVFVFSDFQGVKEIPKGDPDLVIVLGDIYWSDAQEIDRMYDCPKIGVYGNHDSPGEWKNTQIKIIHEELFEYNGVRFAGFGGCPKYNRKSHQYTEEECNHFMRSVGPVDVFIAHSNPAYDNINERHFNDAHRGFTSFATYIEENEPKYFLHGHIHNPFIEKRNNTTVCSVYPFLELKI